MNLLDIVINSAGRIRSGWRFVIYLLAYTFAVIFFSAILLGLLAVIFGRPAAENFFGLGPQGVLRQGIFTLVIATLIGSVCGLFLEGLPFKAIGWGLHRGWLKDLIVGSFVGFATLLLAIAIITLLGGYRFSFNNTASTSSILTTVFGSLIVYIIAAAAEEVAFRGYPLQTMARSHIGWAWVAILFLSVSFGMAHLGNPNVSFRFTFINTVLAGIWLSVAFLKTRSLWFPLGVHWSWNWLMGSVFGIPVSGITTISPAPLLKVSISEPFWLSGGSYGVEGGIACGIAILISTIAIYFLPVAKPTEEMYALTSKENPTGAQASLPAMSAEREKNFE